MAQHIIKKNPKILFYWKEVLKGELHVIFNKGIIREMQIETPNELSLHTY